MWSGQVTSPTQRRKVITELRAALRCVRETESAIEAALIAAEATMSRRELEAMDDEPEAKGPDKAA